MKKKLKLLFSIVTMFICIATFAFGVYAASTLSYTLNGNISYTMNNVFVDVETTLYRSTLSTLTDEATLQTNVTSLKNGTTIQNTEVVSSYTKAEKVSTYSLDNNKFLQSADVATGGAKDLPIYYGAYNTTEGTAYAYYAVVTITNVGPEKISAVVKNKSGDLSDINSFICITGNTQIEGTTDPTVGVVGRIVFGFSLKNEYDSVIKAFEYLISISVGEYPDVVVTQVADVDSEYGFIRQGNGAYISNNKGVSNSSAIAEIDIYADCTLTLNWKVSCDYSSGLYIYVNEEVKLNNQHYNEDGTLTLTLVQGDVVRVVYEKDSNSSGSSSYTDSAIFTFSYTLSA